LHYRKLASKLHFEIAFCLAANPPSGNSPSVTASPFLEFRQ
jgi:hypothetical protein